MHRDQALKIPGIELPAMSDKMYAHWLQILTQNFKNLQKMEGVRLTSAAGTVTREINLNSLSGNAILYGLAIPGGSLTPEFFSLKIANTTVITSVTGVSWQVNQQTGVQYYPITYPISSNSKIEIELVDAGANQIDFNFFWI